MASRIAGATGAVSSLKKFIYKVRKDLELPKPFSGALALPAGSQLVETTQYERLTPIGVLDVVELQIGQSTQQGRNRNLTFNAGQLGADAIAPEG